MLIVLIIRTSSTLNRATLGPQCHKINLHTNYNKVLGTYVYVEARDNDFRRIFKIYVYTKFAYLHTRVIYLCN